MSVLASNETIRSRQQRYGGHTTGFDYLRIALAIAVVMHHSLVVTDQPLTEWLWTYWPRGFLATLLPAFFALSGFLVAGSLIKRVSIPAFVAMRLIRVVPALTVEVLLSAFIIGPWLTHWDLWDYFTSSQFWKYFLNIVGHVQYILPGMFEQNPFPDVINQSLWTIPYELDSYIWLVFLSLFGFVKNHRMLVAVIMLLMTLGTIWLFIRFKPEWQQNPVDGRALVVAFLAGIAIQYFGDVIRLNKWAALAAFLLGSLLLLDVRLSFLGVIPIAYATVYLGLFNPPRRTWLLTGDYSYGLYLFAFPIQQAEVALMPAYASWGYNVAIALVAGLAYAAFSWWIVEKPILSRKTEVAAFADRVWDGVRARWRRALPRTAL
jgi:peptidoglycan/LPS O-acetylase OafA/YrhL